MATLSIKHLCNPAGSANAARVIAVLAPGGLPFEPKLTNTSSAPQARLLAARAAKNSKRLRVPTDSEPPAPYLQTTP